MCAPLSPASCVTRAPPALHSGRVRRAAHTINWPDVVFECLRAGPPRRRSLSCHRDLATSRLVRLHSRRPRGQAAAALALAVATPTARRTASSPTPSRRSRCHPPPPRRSPMACRRRRRHAHPRRVARVPAPAVRVRIGKGSSVRLPRVRWTLWTSRRASRGSRPRCRSRPVGRARPPSCAAAPPPTRCTSTRALPTPACAPCRRPAKRAAWPPTCTPCSRPARRCWLRRSSRQR